MKVTTSKEQFDHKRVKYLDHATFKRCEENDAVETFAKLLNNPKNNYKPRYVQFSTYDRFFDIEWERDTTAAEMEKFQQEEREYQKTAKTRQLKEVSAKAKKLGFKLVKQ